MASSLVPTDISKRWVIVMASVGHASTHMAQKMQRSMLIS